jgi:hypothetical protein
MASHIVWRRVWNNVKNIRKTKSLVTGRVRLAMRSWTSPATDLSCIPYKTLYRFYIYVCDQGAPRVGFPMRQLRSRWSVLVPSFAGLSWKFLVLGLVVDHCMVWSGLCMDCIQHHILAQNTCEFLPPYFTYVDKVKPLWLIFHFAGQHKISRTS